MKFQSLALGLAASILASVGAGAEAAVVEIKNNSFEANPVADGVSRSGSLKDWRYTGAMGWQNPSASMFPSVPDGQQTAWLGYSTSTSGLGSFAQTLATTIEANTRYSLSVDVGRRLDFEFMPFLVEILAGEAVVASGSYAASDIDPGAFRGLTLSWDAGAASELPLSIRFRATAQNRTAQVNFDNVRMETSAIAAAVPEPATWAMMIMGFGAAGAMLRRRQSMSA